MLFKHSWFRQNGLFYTILAFVLLIHICLLAVRIYRDMDMVQTAPQTKTSPPMKVTFTDRPKSSSMLKKQIVQSDGAKSENTPNNSRFLSDQNRTFDRQTLAKKIDKFNRGGKGDGKKDVKDISLSDLAAFDKSHNPLKEGAKAIAATKRMMASKSVSGTASGDPSQTGVSATNDFVEGVPLGDVTYLNTTEYKYYGFFLRIRQKLEQFWGRSIQDKAAALIKNGRQVASDENLITSLEVTLNSVGEIVAIAIKGTSGVKELDDAAVESFNDAGPFPNPPQGLMENGLVKVEWGFVVQTSQGVF
jgi:hypothetical protein